MLALPRCSFAIGPIPLNSVLASKPPPRWRAPVGPLDTLALVVPQGRQDAPNKVRQGIFIGIGNLRSRQPRLRYIPRRQRLCSRPEHVYGAAVDRAALEPRVRLATLHGDAPQVECRV